jgi:hypothetical protein
MQTLTSRQEIQTKEREQFIKRALAARDRFLQTGIAVDGNAFGDYLKAKVRGLKNPERPSLGF